MEHLRSNYVRVYEEVRSYSSKFNLKVPNIICVSKKRDIEQIKFFVSLGQKLFGENYVQEGIEKIALLKDKNLEFHLIGHLQSNKSSIASKNFSCIQTVDSLKIVRNLAKEIMPNYFIQVNPTKNKDFGLSIENVLDFVDQTNQELGLNNFKGIMCIGDPVAEIGLENKKREFSKIKELTLKVAVNFKLTNLKCSMGMSDDFLLAIEMGSDILRIGSLFFEERKFRTHD